MFRRDWNWWSNSQPPLTRSAPPDAFAAPDGSCPPDLTGQARGIALGMTECDLVRAAGSTDQVMIGANERGERTAVFTYPEGERAGTYRFVSGLLVAIERAPEPPRSQRRREPQRQPPARRPEPRGY